MDDATPASKRCRVCGETKPPTAFYRHPTTRDGRQGLCMVCQRKASGERFRANRDRENASRRQRYAANREQERANVRAFHVANPRARHGYLLRTNYGLTVEQYDEMLAAQGGVCAICGDSPNEKRRLAVDEHPDTGAIRELLCVNCNPGLGKFKDSPELLRKAADYLERHS